MARERAHENICQMRILAYLGDLSAPGGAVDTGPGLAPKARGLARLAGRHELVLAHADGVDGRALELALRNDLPGRELAVVPIDVVVEVDGASSRPPSAIVSLGSVRTLIDAGVLVICAVRSATPLALDGLGAMRVVDGRTDGDRAAALLARRLDADLLVLLTDDDRPADAKLEAAHAFARGRDRRAAIGAVSEVAGLVSGAAGIQINFEWSGRGAG